MRKRDFAPIGKSTGTVPRNRPCNESNDEGDCADRYRQSPPHRQTTERSHLLMERARIARQLAKERAQFPDLHPVLHEISPCGRSHLISPVCSFAEVEDSGILPHFIHEDVEEDEDATHEERKLLQPALSRREGPFHSDVSKKIRPVSDTRTRLLRNSTFLTHSLCKKMPSHAHTDGRHASPPDLRASGFRQVQQPCTPWLKCIPPCIIDHPKVCEGRMSPHSGSSSQNEIHRKDHDEMVPVPWSMKKSSAQEQLPKKKLINNSSSRPGIQDDSSSEDEASIMDPHRNDLDQRLHQRRREEQLNRLVLERSWSLQQSVPSANIDGESEEQAVNLRRQEWVKEQSGPMHANSSTTKRDNISQALQEALHTAEPEGSSVELQRASELHKAKERLKELTAALAVVIDINRTGGTLPKHILKYVQCELPEQDRGEVEANQVPRSNRSSSDVEHTRTGGQHRESLEMSLDTAHELGHDLHQQIRALQEEQERLKRAHLELGKLHRALPKQLQEKKNNTQIDVQSLQQQLLAKRRELEELMRKDQGTTSAINQDICSEMSTGKPETRGYCTSNATWGGSVQDPLDEQMVHDDHGQEGNAAYARSVREANNMSIDASVSGGIITLGSDNVSGGSIAGSNPPMPSAPSHASRRPSPHNVWRKGSAAGSGTPIRATWSPLHQLNTTSDEHGNANFASNSFNGNNNEEDSIINNSSQLNWWLQQTSQLQSQQELNNSIQDNIQPPTLTPSSLSRGQPDIFYQQLLAGTQLQQQQLMLTTMNQVCHLLWLQQREMANLRSALLTIQDKSVQHSGDGISPVTNSTGQPGEQVFIAAHNDPQPPSHSNLNQENFNPPHQALKLSYSGGLFQQPEDLAACSGVTSAQSLPNLSHNSAPGSVFSENPQQHTVYIDVNNSAGQDRRSSAIPQTGSMAPWLQPVTADASAHLTRAVGGAPVPTLNNQVPPGNRANNYWDNFRSYSRQNLLSSSTKSNEGASHNPSPVLGRSRNRLSTTRFNPQPDVASPRVASAPVLFTTVGLPPSDHNIGRKMKMNIEPQHGAISSNYSMDVRPPRAATSGTLDPSLALQTNRRQFHIKHKNSSSIPDSSQFTETNTASVKMSSAAGDKCDTHTSDFSETLYAEMEALISAHESRPQFLVHLFRDLQLVTSDAVRQLILDVIQNIVTEHVGAAGSDCEPESWSVNQCHVNECSGGGVGPYNEDDVAKGGGIEASSLQHGLPRNAAPYYGEVPSTPIRLARDHVLEWEMSAPSIIMDLLPFLNMHLNDICTPALLEMIRVQVVQITTVIHRDAQPGSTQQLMTEYFESQLDAQLEDALNKFHGCKLGDVCQDLVTVLSEILESELTFLKLMNTRHEMSLQVSSDNTCKNTASHTSSGLMQENRTSDACGQNEGSHSTSVEPDCNDSLNAQQPHSRDGSIVNPVLTISVEEAKSPPTPKFEEFSPSRDHSQNMAPEIDTENMMEEIQEDGNCDDLQETRQLQECMQILDQLPDAIAEEYDEASDATSHTGEA